MYAAPGQFPSSALVFLVGVLSFFGYVAIGRFAVRCRISDPWELPLAAIVGVILTALLVEVAGMTNCVVPRGLAIASLLFMIAGAWQILRSLRDAEWQRLLTWAATPPGAVCLTANFITLLIALAPSSKIDELYYHMRAPARLLEDGGLVFYRYPWEGAILPQMHYQFALTLTHAVGVPDAGNVVSWCCSVVVQVLVGQLLAANPNLPKGTPTLLASAAGVGTLAMTFHVACGAHAFGLLAVVATVVLAAPVAAKKLSLSASGPERVLLVSVFALGAVMSKITLLPLVACCIVATILSEHFSGRAKSELTRWCGIALAPWVLGYAPLLAWTAIHSGCPLGPAFSDVFGSSVYAIGEGQLIRDRTLAINRVGGVEFLKNSMVAQSPLVWFGVFACMALPGVPARIRWYGLALTALQFGLIFSVIQNDIRFVGGYQIGLLVVVVAATSVCNWQVVWRSPVSLVVLALGVLPWVVGMAYYATVTPFGQTAMGLVSRETFVAHHTAFREDFIKLDGILPADAVLLVSGVRLNAANAPRPTIFDDRDQTLGRKPYLFHVGEEPPALESYSVAELVYENANAITVAFRRPGTEPITGRVRVFRLVGRGVERQ